MSQMTDLVVRINSVQKSSKSELSSRGKRPFKVCEKFEKVGPASVFERKNKLARTVVRNTRKSDGIRRFVYQGDTGKQKKKRQIFLSQTTQNVMRINSVQKSSKSELSSVIFGPSKVSLRAVQIHSLNFLQPSVKKLKLDPRPKGMAAGHNRRRDTNPFQK